jgi:metal-responsive CopG/Arc/MetJ family transcriptional regulator
MANFKESKVVAAAAQAALKEASDEEDNRQIKVREVKALYDHVKAALAKFESRMEQCSSDLSKISNASRPHW